MKVDNNIVNVNYYPQSSIDGHSRTDSAEKIMPEIPSNQGAVSDTRAQTSEQKKENEHEVIQAIEKANKHIKTYDRKLEFSIHDSTKQIMVKVINTDTDQVIREIPSEKILDMVAHMWEVAGILVDEKR